MLKKVFAMSIVLLGLILLSGCTKNPSPSTDNASKQQFHKLDVYQEFSHPEVGQNEKRYTASESISKWTPLSESRKVAIDKAKDFCAKTDTKMILMKEHVANLPFLINHYPKVELSFVCHKMNKKAVNQDKKVIFSQQKVQKIPIIKEKYKNLLFLKKLLDDGVLTQREFDLEKKKLLQEKQ